MCSTQSDASGWSCWSLVANKEFHKTIDFKLSGFKLPKCFSSISHILSTHIDHALMRKCHMWDASHIAHLQFCGKLDVMSIMIITRTHFYLTPARRSENTTRLRYKSFQKEGCGIAIWIISVDDVDTFKDLFSKIQNISIVSKTKNIYFYSCYFFADIRRLI